MLFVSKERMEETMFDETAAIIAARNGDKAAFGALVREYQRRAYAVAYGFVRNREEALDLAQEAFVRVYHAIDRFDPKMPFYPWFYRILANTCLNYLKKKKRRNETSLDSLVEQGYDAHEPGNDPSELAHRQDQRYAVRAAMDRLSPEHREILRLRHLQEMSYVEIAKQLGIPAGTVMSRLHAARLNLRKVLEGEKSSFTDAPE
jgi:RNA polymerase sigma-70 factor (ECF subfamily)